MSQIKRLEVNLLNKEEVKTYMETLNKEVITIEEKNPNKTKVNHSNLFKMFLNENFDSFVLEYEKYLKTFVANDPRLEEKQTQKTQKQLIKELMEENKRLKNGK